MHKDNVLLSLCIPTNGVTEWVKPVLDSIINQNVDKDLYEIVITDNGSNHEFKSMMRGEYGNYDNIVYEETDALPFLNEIESYKRARGLFIKFVNHRTRLVPGALEKLIKYVRENADVKPVTYFSNGVLKLEKKSYTYGCFDDFVRNLSYWSSWSTGMGIWKEDFDKLPKDIGMFNELFPHTTVLFNERKKSQYVIDNSVIMDEIPQGKKPKGSYDLFWAFGIEYPGILCDLLRDRDITLETYHDVLDDNLEFVINLYIDYCVHKNYCSYDLSGVDSMLGVFYTSRQFNRKYHNMMIKRAKNKLLKR